MLIGDIRLACPVLQSLFSLTAARTVGHILVIKFAVTHLVCPDTCDFVSKLPTYSTNQIVRFYRMALQNGRQQ